ncbi:hypothetical protein SDJN02_22522, partial [Cucurbita argyrosperma subsp. argyrosperma]
MAHGLYSSFRSMSLEARSTTAKYENSARTALKLRINIPKSKEYACVFQREHRKNLIQLHVR